MRVCSLVDKVSQSETKSSQLSWVPLSTVAFSLVDFTKESLFFITTNLWRTYILYIIIFWYLSEWNEINPKVFML